MARPTKYNEDILLFTQKYIDECVDSRDDNGKIVNLPSIEGLAYELRLNKTTIYAWRKEHEEFSNLIDDLLAKQAKALINSGLSGAYNSTIAKVILTKHGYREGIDATTDDKPLNSNDDVKDLIKKFDEFTNKQDKQV